jgi:hypothetical protein
VATQLTQPVRLLIVAEAPPWRATGEVSYVYKPNDERYSGGLVGPMVQAVGRHLGLEESEIPNFTKSNAASKERALAFLGAHGVLLVDPLPFALAYSKHPEGQHGSLRGNDAYRQLCACGWQLAVRDMEEAAVALHPRCVVACSLLNSVRGVLSGGTTLPLPHGRSANVHAETAPAGNCFANSAGYPDAKVLGALLKKQPMPAP